MDKNITVTNDEILDALHNLMQMTSDGFIRLEQRINEVARLGANAEGSAMPPKQQE